MLFAALLALAVAEDADLRRAEAQFHDLDYAGAERSAEALLSRRNLSRATLVRALELAAVSAAILGKPGEAERQFRVLLSLEPDRPLPPDVGPKVRTPFNAAKTFVAERGALRLAPRPAEVRPGRVQRIAVAVESDPLGLGKKVRFSISEDGPFEPTEAPLEQGEASAEVRGTLVKWHAELLSDRGAVLAELGSAETPMVAMAPSPPPPAPALAATAPPLVEAPAPQPSPGLSTRRKAALAAFGASAAALAGATVFGLNANASYARIENAPKDAFGRTVGLTMTQADQLRETGRAQATTANILFAVTGAAAAAGIALWVEW